MTSEKFHFGPTDDQLRERELIRQIEMLKREFYEASRPFIEELALIRARQPLPPLILQLTEEQIAEVKKRIPCD
jgi:hypothetical protein